MFLSVRPAFTATDSKAGLTFKPWGIREFVSEKVLMSKRNIVHMPTASWSLELLQAVTCAV